MSHESPNAGNKSGFWVYNSFVLRLYDILVPGLLNRFVWRCPTGNIHSLYRRHLSPNHLDIGIGTGYYLSWFFRDQKQRQEKNAALLGTECFCERLLLADAHPATLDFCRERLMRIGTLAEGQIQTQQINVTKHDELTRFANRITGQRGLDSIAANYLMHCLPKGLHSSEPLVAFAKHVLAEDGVFFGSTILGSETDKRLKTKMIAGLFRRMKIFGQRKDKLDELRSLLNKHFPFCDIEVHGCVALFAASCQDFH